MTREELQAVVEIVLGIHAQPDRIDTIMRAADAYATHVACEALKPIPVEAP